LFPRLRHLFADSVYNRADLRDALAKFGDWTIEIVKRTADAAGFQLLPRCRSVKTWCLWRARGSRGASSKARLYRRAITSLRESWSKKLPIEADELRQLLREGVSVGRRRIRRLMRKLGLWAVRPKRNTSKRHPEHKVYPYHCRTGSPGVDRAPGRAARRP
jgi:transposase